MEQLISQIAEKTGISNEQATKVVEFLKEHGPEVIAAVSEDGVGGGVDTVKEKIGGLAGGLGGMLGGD